MFNRDKHCKLARMNLAEKYKKLLLGFRPQASGPVHGVRFGVNCGRIIIRLGLLYVQFLVGNDVFVRAWYILMQVFGTTESLIEERIFSQSDSSLR